MHQNITLKFIKDESLELFIWYKSNMLTPFYILDWVELFWLIFSKEFLGHCSWDKMTQEWIDY